MKKELLELSYTLSNIDAAALDFWEKLGQYRIFAFSGEMGAGKTTFIHKLCDHLLVEDTVSSPTFALINEYHFPENGKDSTIYHMDWYRLRNTAEAINTGMDDAITQSKKGATRCFIEWPEKAIDLLVAPYIWLAIETISPEERKLTAWLNA